MIKLIKLKASHNRLTDKLAKLQIAAKRKRQRGMTLLEIIIVLGIIGTIAAGVVILAQRAFDSKKLSDLTTNVNTIRVAMKDVFGAEGLYPVLDSTDTLALTTSNLNDTKSLQAPIDKLIAMGKLSAQEAINPYSGDFINVGGADLGIHTDTGALNKGYVIEINGLDQKQCRGLLAQTINNWDFVQVIAKGGASKKYDDKAGGGINLTAPAAATKAGATATDPVTINASEGIFRSLDKSQTVTISSLTTACGAGSANLVILGSR